MQHHTHHHQHAQANEEVHGTSCHRGDGILHSVPNGQLQLHNRSKKALKWTLLAASVLAIGSLQNMFWFSLRVIPHTAALYSEIDQMDVRSVGGIDGVDGMKNSSFTSTVHLTIRPQDDHFDATRTGRRVVVLSDRPFSFSLDSDRMPHRPWGELVNPPPMPTLGAGSNNNDPPDVDSETNNNFLLSTGRTIIMDKIEEDGRYRDFEREWFQECESVTGPYQEVSTDAAVNLIKWIRPTCNDFHELDFMADDDLMTNINNQRTTNFPTGSIELLSMEGSWRSVWKVTTTANYTRSDSDAPRSAALKLLQLDRDFNEESFSIHQMDAMVMERLTASPHIIDSYGFCGQSVLTAFAESSGRARIKDPTLRWLDRLRIGRDLAQGLADLHALQPTGSSSSSSSSSRSNRKESPPPLLFAHHDINMANLIAVKEGRVQWNDFNLGIVTRQNRKAGIGDNQDCPVPIRYGGPLWRSPEEILNQTGYLTNVQAADIYSLGNVLFQVLTKHQPWSHLESVDDNGNNNNTTVTNNNNNNNSTKRTLPTTNSTKQSVVAKVVSSTDGDSKEEALRMIAKSKIDGHLPNVPDRYVARNEAQIIWNATKACYRRNPMDRPTALEVAAILGKAYDKYNEKNVNTANGKRKYIR